MLNVSEKFVVAMQRSDLHDQRNTRVPPISDDPCWQAAQRIVASTSFAKSTRLSSFLLYVCEKAIRGCADEITEQQIGVNVFGRSTDYNPGDDNIVRGAARQLRQRLALYYQEGGAQEHLRISIPRGGYVPVFDTLSSIGEDTSTKPLPLISARDDGGTTGSSTNARAFKMRGWVQYASLAGFFLLGILTTILWQSPHTNRIKETPTSPLWRTLFTPQRRTIIVAGDAGLNMFSNLARRKVAVAEYDQQAYFNSPFAETPKGYTWTPFVRRNYTSFADLVLVSKLVRRPEVIQDRLDIRFARNLSIDDLKGPNLILIGSENYNPWVRVFQRNQNFDLVWHGDTNTTEITNSSPQPGEQATYPVSSEPNPEHRVGYALIDFVNPSATERKVLIIKGTSMLGVDAAIDFISQEIEFGKVLQKARTTDGTLKSFEVLLQSEFMDGNTQNTHVIATRFHS